MSKKPKIKYVVPVYDYDRGECVYIEVCKWGVPNK